MSPKGKMSTALAVAAFAIPAMAVAQQGYGQPQDPQSYGQSQPGYGQPDPGPAGQAGYGQSGAGTQGYGPEQAPGPGEEPMQGGKMHRHKAQPSVYPQFRSLEKHIRHTVHQERKANMLAKRDAHKLMAQLKQIQAEEASVYQAHGVNLPPDIQSRIQGELTQLAQAVDQTQGPPRSGQPYQGQR